MGFPDGSVVKNLPACAEDVSLIPGSEKFPGEEIATHSTVLAWEIPWVEKLGWLQSRGSQRVGHDLTTKQQQST